ncbi:MAG: TonB-dependent receptor [Tannerellaceae bacterium]|nr:TonB-dependent receptor [Tannerellaceae bacterium]
MSNGMKNMRVALMMLLTTITFGLSAQNVAISGNIVDVTGEPIIGASVLEKGTTNGTITDFDGNFTLNITGNVPLVISYIGMRSQEVNVQGKTIFNIVLEDDTQALEEVVVIGYGTAKRKDLTGSVASVSADVIASAPVSSAMEAITGRMAGVQISTNEGSPDAEMNIRVRGGGSITGDNTPLFIVDGFPVESISDIAPGDIESIDILKDASSTAIYGSRGANGVVIVTTKSGKEGKVSVNYNAYISFKKIAKTLDVLDAGDYINWQWELANLKGDTNKYIKFFGDPQDRDLYRDANTNDWQDIVFGRTGVTHNHNISITGGSDKVKYAFSYTLMDDKAIMLDSKYRRDNATFKVNTKPHEKVNVDFSLRYAKTTIKGGGANEVNEYSSSDSRLRHAMLYPPFPVEGMSAADDDSEDGENPSNLYHPVENIRDNDQLQKRWNYNLSTAVTYQPIKNLRIKAEFGIDDNRRENNRFYGLTTYYVRNRVGEEDQNKPAVILTNTSLEKLRSTNTISYDFKQHLKKTGHSLNILAGQEYIIGKEKILTTTTHGLEETFTSSQAFKFTQQGNAFSIDNYQNPNDILLSFFGRVNYDFESKYILSATFRSDGSSKFGEGNKWGFFPSAAVAWRVSSESFMEKTSEWLDDLKLRFSYGTAGNNNIPSGQITRTYGADTTPWIYNGTTYFTTSKILYNPDLKWETTYTRNLGLDFTILNGILSGTAEIYLNNTKDLLINFPVSGSGYDTQYRNMGETENKGLEVTLNWNILNKKNYGLSFSGNIGFNKNKIKSLGVMNDFGQNSGWASSEIGDDYWVAVGGRVGQMYGYVTEGRYEASDFEGYDGRDWILKEGVVDPGSVLTAMPGALKLTDLNKDGVIDDNDKTIIGDANPKFIGGFSLNGRIYNFDIAANFSYSYGNKVYNANKIEYTSSSKYSFRNMTTEMAAGNRWTNMNAEGEITYDLDELAALNTNTTMWSPYMGKYVFHSWAVEDGSFLRLNTLTLGYTLPKTLLNRAKIQNIRFYVTGYNLFCWTGYTGFDPEVSTRRSTTLTPNVDYSAYPKSRQFVVGFNLSF